MKKMSPVFVVLLVVSIIFVLLGCSSTLQVFSSEEATVSQAPSQTAAKTAEALEKKYKIGIVQYVEHPALDAAREGFIQALADNGFMDGLNITIDIQNAQADQTSLKTISQRFVNRKEDLILAIAAPAAQAVISETKEIPVLGTVISDYVAANLVDSNGTSGGNISGTTDMNPVKEQIGLLKQLVPDVKTVGLLYTSGEDNSVLQADLAKKACLALGLNVVEATVTCDNDVQLVTQSLVEKVDAIYIPSDKVVASCMPIVSGITLQSKIPTICGEENMVLNGGMATVEVDYSQLGYQTGKMAAVILKGEANIGDMPIESPKKCVYKINGDFAEAIGLEIPSDLSEYVFSADASASSSGL